MFFYFITISYREMYILFTRILEIWVTCLFTYESYAWVLTDCQHFLQFLTSPEEERSVLSKRCIIYNRVSQEECARLREGVPYVKVYRYNPKHLCPKLNGYGDNGQRSLKL